MTTIGNYLGVFLRKKPQCNVLLISNQFDARVRGESTGTTTTTANYYMCHFLTGQYWQN